MGAFEGKVALVSRTRGELEETAAAIGAAGGPPALVLPADLGRVEEVDRAFDEARRALGPVDVLICAAARLLKAPVEEVSPEALDALLAVNVRGVYRACQLAFAHMRGRGGAIVTLSSLGGIRSTEKFPGLSAYVVSKAAICGLTEALAVEGRPLSIRVNCVAPGAVKTRMLEEAAPFLRTRTLPDDVARLCLYLADEARSGRVSGSIVEVHSNE